MVSWRLADGNESGIWLLNQYTETEPKWPTFSKRQLQMHFIK